MTYIVQQLNDGSARAQRMRPRVRAPHRVDGIAETGRGDERTAGQQLSGTPEGVGGGGRPYPREHGGDVCVRETMLWREVVTRPK